MVNAYFDNIAMYVLRFMELIEKAHHVRDSVANPALNIVVKDHFSRKTDIFASRTHRNHLFGGCLILATYGYIASLQKSIKQ